MAKMLILLINFLTCIKYRFSYRDVVAMNNTLGINAKSETNLFASEFYFLLA
jgi:hypothetical protein